MTYCVGLKLNHGLVFMSDTRTNAGVDNFSTTKKMFTWEVPGDRVITVMTAGNLATTQALISLLEERSKRPSERSPTILEQPTMFQVARLVGSTLKEVIADSAGEGQAASAGFKASVIVGGQIKGGLPTLFLIYPEGNFIEVTDDAPFFQIGEAKYGKPILVRGYEPDLSFADTIKLLMVSFDSTIKANLSVGLPLDLQVYENDSFAVAEQTRIEADNEYFQTISQGWGEALRTALMHLPSYQRS
ncbi:proteasome-type protease [Shimia thalassica]|uniref:proteasome-type protease n=1 Tax=Shimia thalassica TaxID=1715693 RepID=UPI00249544B1|nr:proteasome-type protease [Shimia thalassica]MDO6797135.1 proteasome-type protease [Shimia thalassica]MDP2492718.1 proteasome-type protease [Shimia thalassica]